MGWKYTDEEISNIENELKLLKERRLFQDQQRMEQYEKQFVEESDAVILAKLHPIVKVMMRKLLIQCKQAGLKFGIYSGLRTFDEQNKLYSKGRRFENGNWVIINKAEIVTNSKCGYSWHNYGLACDFVIRGSKNQWTWNSSIDTNRDGRNDWNHFGEIAESNGLTWGGRWKPPDIPHVQYHGGIKDINSALTLYNSGGIYAVWEKVV